MTLPLSWRKSSRSTNTDNCVEVRGDLRAVRDSKDPRSDVRMLTFPAEGVAALVAAVRNDQLA